VLVLLVIVSTGLLIGKITSLFVVESVAVELPVLVPAVATIAHIAFALAPEANVQVASRPDTLAVTPVVDEPDDTVTKGIDENLAVMVTASFVTALLFKAICNVETPVLAAIVVVVNVAAAQYEPIANIGFMLGSVTSEEGVLSTAVTRPSILCAPTFTVQIAPALDPAANTHVATLPFTAEFVPALNVPEGSELGNVATIVTAWSRVAPLFRLIVNAVLP
jgi:hypothetical protein